MSSWARASGLGVAALLLVFSCDERLARAEVVSGGVTEVEVVLRDGQSLSLEGQRITPGASSLVHEMFLDLDRAH